MTQVQEVSAKKRRFSWWWLIAPGVVLLAAAAIALASQQSTYRFLGGFADVKVALTPTEQKEASKQGFHMAAYRAEADFAQVVQHAEAELVPLGFKKDSEAMPNSVAFIKGSLWNFGTTPGQEPPQLVGIFKGVKLKDGLSGSEIDESLAMGHGQAKGWISVIVMGQSEPSLFDKFKAWVGL